MQHTHQSSKEISHIGNGPAQKSHISKHNSTQHTHKPEKHVPVVNSRLRKTKIKRRRRDFSRDDEDDDDDDNNDEDFVDASELASGDHHSSPHHIQTTKPPNSNPPVDFGTLDITALNRYKTHFRLRTRTTGASSKQELVASINKHWTASWRIQKGDELEILSAFVLRLQDS
eukprot:TRINITY_DN9456_c0_g1_i1.p1 TRINITY_DN9456_c0_g1~~TRINITY_DN9456_c0_g1_i1.p1  ORF type:complete len:187 (+),score=41.26 TRINITY_DN9456_c0_g1_i1:47-562(+)